MSNTDRDEVVVDGKTKLIVSASNIDVGIIAGTLLVYTTPCFEALTIISGYSITPDFFQKVKDIFSQLFR